MKVLDGIRELSAPLASSALTIGNFDGVHLGHQALFRRLVSTAKDANVPSVVMTFDPHPFKVLHPDRHQTRIFDFDDQARCLKAIGVDLLVIEPFSREFSQVTPERYLNEWIYRPFSPLAVIVGYDFSFGAERKGSIEFLRRQAGELGIDVDVIAPVKVGGEICSSTRIRQSLRVGDVALAQRLMGRFFYVEGLVERGAGRGRTIGIPTANLMTTAETLPAQGVYAAYAVTDEGRFKCVVNIGLNPTFVHGGHMTIEAHILDFASDLYGSRLKLEFVERLRSEKKFAGVDELVAQIRADIAAARGVLV